MQNIYNFRKIPFRTYLAGGVGMFLLLLSTSFAGVSDTGVTLEGSLLTRICKDSPAIEAARQDWETAKNQPDVVSALPDPMLTYGYYFSSVETRIGPLEQKIGLAQKIPFPGKLSAARQHAEAQAQIAYWHYRATIRDVLAQAKILSAELLRVMGSVTVLQEQESLLRQAASSAEARFKGNQASLPDVIRATVAAEAIATKITGLKAQRIGLLAKVAALLGKSEVPAEVPFRPSSRLPKLPALASAMQSALVVNQELQAATLAVARDETAVRQAQLAYYPDVTFGIDYTQAGDNRLSNPVDSGSDPVMGLVTVNLPIWWKKLGAQKKASKSRREASVSRRLQLTLDTRARVAGAHAVARSARDQHNRFVESIVPDAERAYESITSNYSSGSASLTDLLDVQRAYLAAKIGSVERTSGYLQAIALLEQAVGEPLEALKGGGIDSPE